MIGDDGHQRSQTGEEQLRYNAFHDALTGFVKQSFIYRSAGTSNRASKTA